MKPGTDPAHAFVVAVGVEKSAIFDEDPLLGPVHDALRIAQWALDRGVPPQRIRLFISPKAASQAALEAWTAAHPAVRRSAATEQAIRDFVAREIEDVVPPAGAQGLLVVAWSGHGLIDVRAAVRTRRLFYEDTRAKPPLHMDATRLLQALNTPRLAAFNEQVIVIDACATSSTFVLGTGSLGDATNLGGSAELGRSAQWVMAAASPGETAETEADEQAVLGSRFIQRLVQRLAPAAGEPWPDFADAFERTRATFDPQGQTPMSWAHGTDPLGLTEDGRLVLSTGRATTLARAVQGAGLSDAALRAAYAAALPSPAIGTSHAGAAAEGIAAMVEVLAGSAAGRDGVPALHRYAYEATVRAAGAAAGGLTEWLRGEGVATTAIDAELARRRTAPGQGLVFVLIDGVAPGDEAGARAVCAHAFVGKAREPTLLTDDANPIVIDDHHSREDALGAVIALALQHAALLGIEEPTLVLEFALPLARLDEAVESMKFGAGTACVAQRHLVVRRVAERLHALQQLKSPAALPWLSDIVAWRKNATEMRARFERHGLRIFGMRPDRLLQEQLGHALTANPQGSCVSLEGALENGLLTGAARSALRQGALPFACWPVGKWSRKDASRLEQDLGPCVDQPTLRRLFELRREHGFQKHPATRLVFLWDDPLRNPAGVRLGA